MAVSADSTELMKIHSLVVVSENYVNLEQENLLAILSKVNLACDALTNHAWCYVDYFGVGLVVHWYDRDFELFYYTSLLVFFNCHL